MKLSTLFLVAGLLTCTACSTYVPALESRNEVGDPVIGTASTAASIASVVGGGGTGEILSCPSGRLEYIPLPALSAWGYTEVDAKDGAISVTTKPWPDANNPENRHKLLTNIATNISQVTSTTSGSVGAIFSGSRIKRQYVIDFMKWRAEPLRDTDQKALGWARVGIGLRLIVEIYSGDVDVGGSLISLAASVKSGRVEGSVSAELIGIDSKEVTQAMPLTVDLSEANIQKIAEALAIVKVKMYDDKTTISPNLVAKIQCAATSKK